MRRRDRQLEVSAGPGPRMRRLAVAGVGTLTVSAMVSTGAVLGGLAALTRVRPNDVGPRATVVTVAPSGDRDAALAVTLVGEGAELPGWVALRQDDGALWASPPRRVEGGLLRDAVALPGRAPALLEPGARPVVDHDPWRGADDPLELGAREATYRSPVGDVAVTHTGPTSDRAVVFVHGRGGSRRTGWWYAPAAAARGWRTVMPAYRNDPDGGPRTGRYLLGGEWVDLEAVLGDLHREGVRQVVLVGWSMGGNICASYLRQRDRRPHAYRDHPQVVGLVLDAAVLEWRQVLEHVARQRRLPHRLVPAMMAYGRLASGIEWADLDHLAEPAHLRLPVLAFHGTADDVVPPAGSARLARALPDVALETIEGAGHCRSVNHDPSRYLAAFSAFLARVAGPR